MTRITKDKVKSWIASAGVRALRTFAQTALGGITVGAALSDISWGYVASVAAVSAIYSMLQCIAGIPEVDNGNSLPAIVNDKDA